MIRVAFEGAVKENIPSTLDIVPVVVPLKITDAPGTGSPLDASVMTPDTETFWANTAVANVKSIIERIIRTFFIGR